MHSFTVNEDGTSVDREREPKCLFSHSQLPAYVPRDQLPVRRRPFSTLIASEFVQNFSAAIPREVYDRLSASGALALNFTFARVTMPAVAVIESPFLVEYIHGGDVLLRSQGRCFEDNFIVISNGVLRIEMDSNMHERSGLPGRPIESKGRKHIKSRFAFKQSLKGDAIAPGKASRARLERALKTLFPEPLHWRFIDLKRLQEPDITGPLLEYKPEVMTGAPTHHTLKSCRVPYIPPSHDFSDPEEAEDLFEWTGLLLAGSARLSPSDRIDAYYSTYAVPSFPEKEPTDQRSGLEEEEAAAMVVDLEQDSGSRSHLIDTVLLSYEGLIPARFVIDLWTAVHGRARAGLPNPPPGEGRSSRPVDAAALHPLDWAVFSTSSFDSQADTFMSVGQREVLSWECWL